MSSFFKIKERIGDDVRKKQYDLARKEKYSWFTMTSFDRRRLQEGKFQQLETDFV